MGFRSKTDLIMNWISLFNLCLKISFNYEITFQGVDKKNKSASKRKRDRRNMSLKCLLRLKKEFNAKIVDEVWDNSQCDWMDDWLTGWLAD